MKILVLTPLPSPFVAQPFEQLREHYPKLEIQPVFYGDLSHRPTWGKLGWEGIWLKGSMWKRINQLKALVQQYQPDQVVLGQYNRVESWWLKRYALALSKPAHAFFLEPLIPANRFKYKLKLALFKQFFKGVNSVGCMGRQAFDDYSKIYKGHIFQCPYTFDLSSLLKFDTSKRRKNCTTFLYSGRLCAFRDPLLALRCFAKVAKQSESEVHLIISGTGALEPNLKREIEELKLDASVTWMNDFKDWEDIRNLYRYADVLLSLGVYNTWSLTIQEAMAAGLGVVATHTTEAANSLIVEDFNGYLVDHDNPEAIERAMLRYVNHPEGSSLHGARSREIVRVVDLEPVTQRLAEALNLR
jgi:glycosyltransferase involved in cell wall biosynthesis